MLNDTVAIVLNSPSPLPEITETDLLCADGGYKRVVGAEKNIFVIGDFDSLGKAPSDVPYLSSPVDKDYTDGERAVRYAAEKGVKKIVVYGADGGRMDMQCANLTLLKIAYDLRLDAEISTLTERIFYTEKDFSLTCPIGKRISVIPLGGTATFVDSTGLYYPLQGITLTCADTVGLSNRTTEKDFSLTLSNGGALIFVEK